MIKNKKFKVDEIKQIHEWVMMKIAYIEGSHKAAICYILVPVLMPTSWKFYISNKSHKWY